MVGKCKSSRPVEGRISAAARHNDECRRSHSIAVVPPPPSKSGGSPNKNEWRVGTTPPAVDRQGGTTLPAPLSLYVH